MLASPLTLFIDPVELYNRKFYVSNHHTSKPNYLHESGKTYKRMYPKNYDKYNDVLNKLYNDSIKILTGGFFSAFQQIAVKNKFPIHNSLVAISLIGNASNDTIKILKKKYPNTTIIYRKDPLINY